MYGSKYVALYKCPEAHYFFNKVHPEKIRCKTIEVEAVWLHLEAYQRTGEAPNWFPKEIQKRKVFYHNSLTD
jgi:hypothetical protein